MLKTVAISLWLMGLLSGSMYYFSTAPVTPAVEEGSAEQKQELEYVSLQPMTVAIVRNNEVRGYIILELSFAMDPGAYDDMSKPLELVLNDRIIEALHEDRSIDIFKLDEFDIKAFAGRLVTAVNAKMGQDLLKQILIQDINFVSKEDVRDMLMRKS
jgi:hypothetical protein